MENCSFAPNRLMPNINEDEGASAAIVKPSRRTSWAPPSSKGKRPSWPPAAIAQGPTAQELAGLRSEFGHVRANSAAMQATLGLVARYAPTEVTVTLMGETGAGKDVLAHVIHAQSARASGPLVILDCGAIAATLAESEVLGHERGAFTGAVNSHAGAFERARGGTIFLDEFGELPLELQPRLLRVIDNRQGRRVGGTVDRPFDVRIIAATNRDLRAEVASGRFRQDLFFRLGAAIIPVPPLRDRLDDLPLLVPNLLHDIGRPDLRVSDEAYAAMQSHRWPGNIRELKNCLACAVAFVEPQSELLDAAHIGSVMHRTESVEDDTEIERLPLGGQRLERIERAAIMQTLRQTEGNKVRAAQVLGIAVSTLYEKLKRYRLEDEYVE